MSIDYFQIHWKIYILKLFTIRKGFCSQRFYAFWKNDFFQILISFKSTFSNHCYLFMIDAFRNGQFFLKAGCVVAVIGALDALITLDALLYALLYIFGLAFAFYPLTRWCKQNEGFSWPWPHVQSEKKRIKELRREQQAQENEEKGEK